MGPHDPFTGRLQLPSSGSSACDSELDECNGKMLANGSYAYFLSPVFPFLPPCLRGSQLGVLRETPRAELAQCPVSGTAPMAVAKTLECTTIPQFIFVPVGEDVPSDIRQKWLVSSTVIGVVWIVIGLWLTYDLKPWLVKGRQIYHWTPHSIGKVVGQPVPDRILDSMLEELHMSSWSDLKRQNVSGAISDQDADKICQMIARRFDRAAKTHAFRARVIESTLARDQMPKFVEEIPHAHDFCFGRQLFSARGHYHHDVNGILNIPEEMKKEVTVREQQLWVRAESQAEVEARLQTHRARGNAADAAHDTNRSLSESGQAGNGAQPAPVEDFVQCVLSLHKGWYSACLTFDSLSDDLGYFERRIVSVEGGSKALPQDDDVRVGCEMMMMEAKIGCFDSVGSQLPLTGQMWAAAEMAGGKGEPREMAGGEASCEQRRLVFQHSTPLGGSSQIEDVSTMVELFSGTGARRAEKNPRHSTDASSRTLSESELNRGSTREDSPEATHAASPEGAGSAVGAEDAGGEGGVGPVPPHAAPASINTLPVSARRVLQDDVADACTIRPSGPIMWEGASDALQGAQGAQGAQARYGVMIAGKSFGAGASAGEARAATVPPEPRKASTPPELRGDIVYAGGVSGTCVSDSGPQAPLAQEGSLPQLGSDTPAADVCAAREDVEAAAAAASGKVEVGGDEVAVSLEGVVSKRGQLNRRWVERYFVLLDDGIILYYRDREGREGGEDAYGWLSCQHLTVSVPSRSQLPSSSSMSQRRFEFVVTDAQGKRIECAVDGEAARDRWVLKLEEAARRFDEVEAAAQAGAHHCLVLSTLGMRYQVLGGDDAKGFFLSVTDAAGKIMTCRLPSALDRAAWVEALDKVCHDDRTITPQDVHQVCPVPAAPCSAIARRLALT